MQRRGAGSVARIHVEAERTDDIVDQNAEERLLFVRHLAAHEEVQHGAARVVREEKIGAALEQGAATVSGQRGSLQHIHGEERVHGKVPAHGGLV